MDLVGGQWAGNFDCSVCRKKRLTAIAFSGTQLRKLREGKLAEDSLRCKPCVLATSAARTVTVITTTGEGGDTLICSVCNKQRPVSVFSNTQKRKPDTERKCRECVQRAEAKEAEDIDKKRIAKLTAAQAGNGNSVLGAINESAAEAEIVTGLKPIRGSELRRGRGRGRGRGGSGRGRGKWRGRGGAQ